MKVRDLMTTEVKCCIASDSLITATRLMWDNDIGCVPVVDSESHVLGMLTDRDIAMAAFLQDARLADSGVTSAMSTEVFYCQPEDQILVAERMMREKRVRRLPVVDANGRLAGILSLNDIAREFKREVELEKPREVTAPQVADVLATISAPRHRAISPAA